MYWLGTRGIHDLRERGGARRAGVSTAKRFHDGLLGHGAIPVALTARLMTQGID